MYNTETEALKNVKKKLRTSTSPPIEVYLIKKENISPQLIISINKNKQTRYLIPFPECIYPDTCYCRTWTFASKTISRNIFSEQPIFSWNASKLLVLNCVNHSEQKLWTTFRSHRKAGARCPAFRWCAFCQIWMLGVGVTSEQPKRAMLNHRYGY